VNGSARQYLLARSALQNNVDAAVVDGWSLDPGLTDRFLPDQSAGYPILLELIGHDGTARLCQIGASMRHEKPPNGYGIFRMS
jgi:hypothetical protein